MKKYAIFLSLIILAVILSGCQLTQDESTPFDLSTLVPETASAVETYTLDFHNDGIDEKAVKFINIDDLGENVLLERDHVQVFALKNNEWKSVYSFVSPQINKNTEPYDWKSFVKDTENIRINSVSVEDIANDRKEELFIKTEDRSANRLNDYVVIGLENDQITKVNFQKGMDYINSTSAAVNFYGKILETKIRDNKIIEKWGGTCEGSSEPCYTFELEISHNPAENKWSISKAKNIQQIKEEYDKYLERYEDANEWGGKLTF